MDYKFTPYSEIESCLKYIFERRKAHYLYNQNKNSINESLEKTYGKELVSNFSKELNSANYTVYQAIDDIYKLHLNTD